jgi:cell division inhibitor SepF
LGNRKLVDKVLGFMGFEDDASPEQGGPGETEREVQDSRKRGATVVNLHTQRNVRVVVVEPSSFDDVQEITDHLKNRKPVIVNLEKVDNDLARRIVDFLSGAVYAVSGAMQKVGGGIFLFVPSNVDIDSEIKETERGNFSWMRH